MTLPGDAPGEFGATLDLALATPSSDDKPAIDVKSSDEASPGHRRSGCSPAALSALSAAPPAAETSRGAVRRKPRAYSDDDVAPPPSGSRRLAPSPRAEAWSR